MLASQGVDTDTAAVCQRLTSPSCSLAPRVSSGAWAGFYGSVFLPLTPLVFFILVWVSAEVCVCVSDSVSGGLEETAEFPAATAIDLEATGRTNGS